MSKKDLVIGILVLLLLCVIYLLGTGQLELHPEETKHLIEQGVCPPTPVTYFCKVWQRLFW